MPGYAQFSDLLLAKKKQEATFIIHSLYAQLGLRWSKMSSALDRVKERLAQLPKCQRRHKLIIAMLIVCLNCRKRTIEITIEVILFEYSRHLYRYSPRTIGTFSSRANACCSRQKFCCGRPQKGLLGLYRPQSAMSCSTLRERAA